MIYKFFDRDYYLNSGVFILDGEHYKELMRICFGYSTYFSFAVYREAPLLRLLEPWRTTEPVGHDEDLDSAEIRRYYQANPETYALLVQNTEGFFQERLPLSKVFFEDFIFLRNDFTVFLEEISHEGECTLYTNDNEDVSSVIDFGHWLPCNEYHIPVIPAKDCTLPALNNYALENDWFYHLLIAIHNEPKKYLQEQTMDALETFINNMRFDAKYPGWRVPPLNDLPVPIWYLYFELYILREYDALTTTPLATVFTQNGYYGESAFERFFEILFRFKEEVA